MISKIIISWYLTFSMNIGYFFLSTKETNKSDLIVQNTQLHVTEILQSLLWFVSTWLRRILSSPTRCLSAQTTDHSALELGARVRFTAQTHKHSFSRSSSLAHSLTHSLVSSRPSLWKPWAQTLAMNSRFFHFLYFEDVASILRLRAGEQRAIRPITARLRERKHAALNTNTTSYQQRRTGLSWRIVHFIQTKTLNGQHIVITNICSKVVHLKKIPNVWSSICIITQTKCNQNSKIYVHVRIIIIIIIIKR